MRSETRLFLDMRGPVEGKELRMYVETDFYGSSSVLRLRHAYGSYGGLLAGQTWSTFVDDEQLSQHHRLRVADGLPVDPAGAGAVDAETERERVVVGGGRGQQVDDHATRASTRQGRVSDAGPGRRVSASRARADTPSPPVFLGRARFRPTEGEPDDVTLWGMLLSGRVKTFGKDYAYGQFTFGDGVGRYRGGVTAVPDANGQLQRRRAHRVHGRLRALLVPRALVERRLQRGDGAGEGLLPGRFQQATSTTPPSISSTGSCQNRAWAGVEYLHGRREVFSGQDGTANRLQFAVRFNLP